MAISENTHLVGRVGTAPELKYTPSGKALTKFRLAVDTGYDSISKESVTTWYDVSVWEDLAEATSKLIIVGDRVWVKGKASVYHGTAGDRDQINAYEVGAVDRIIPEGDKSKASAAREAEDGVELVESDEDEW